MDPFVAALFMNAQALSTWDSGFLGTDVTLSADARTATFENTSWQSTRGTRSRQTGKHYFEIECTGASANYQAGFCQAGDAATNPIHSNAGGVGWRGTDGKVYVALSNVATWATFGAGDTICIAIDLDAELVWFRKGAAGNWNNSGSADPATGAGGLDISSMSGAFFPSCSGQSAPGDAIVVINTGHAPFVGARPNGFYIWE